MSENLNNLSQTELIERLTSLQKENTDLKEISAQKDQAFFRNVESSFTMLMAAEGIVQKPGLADIYTKTLLNQKSAHKDEFTRYSSAIYKEAEIVGATPEKLNQLYHAATASGMTEAELYADALKNSKAYGLIVEQVIERAGSYQPVYHNQSQMNDPRYDYDYYPDDPKANFDLLKDVAKVLHRDTLGDPFNYNESVESAAQAMGKLYRVVSTDNYVDNKDTQETFTKYLNDFMYDDNPLDNRALIAIAKQGIVPVDSDKILAESVAKCFQNTQDPQLEAKFVKHMEEDFAPLVKLGVFNDELKGNKEGFFSRFEKALPAELSPTLSSIVNEYKEEAGLTRRSSPRP